MKKIIAQTLDKIALSVFAPSFIPLDETIAGNQSLLHAPIIPPGHVTRIPKVFQKLVKAEKTFEVFHYAFASQIQTASFKNNTVHGRYFKHKNINPKSTAILLHGLCERNYKNIDHYVSRLINDGHDCITMALPYHLERSSGWSLIGSQFMGADLRAMLEGLQQASKDVINVMNWILSESDQKIGIMGINLGAYVTALAASVSRKIDYVVLVAPLTTPIQAFGFSMNASGCPSSKYLLGLSSSQLNRILDPWDLINNKPAITKNKVMIAAASHTPFTPLETTMKLWQEWGMPCIQKYQCGYMSLRWSRRVIEDVIDFLDARIPNQVSAGFR